VRHVNTDLDYLGYLTRESARFVEVLRDVAPHVPVPSCPGWNADDLLWHLGEVQWFWAAVVREDVTGEAAEGFKPRRPRDRDGLLIFFEAARRDLEEILAAKPPESAAWTWSDDKSVAFIRRRQAHEALIHRVDAELTAGGPRSPMDAALSADGVDEALRVLYGGVPDWGTFTPDAGQAIRLRATDTGDSWLVTVGRFTGTDSDGTSYDEPDIHAAESDPGTEAAAEVSGAAADLDCWVWHRPPLGPVERTGDQDVLSRFDSALAPGVN
jgi:uncharacterized protein (TIGR03083 family)